MGKVKTIADFHDKSDIDPKTGVGKFIPAGTAIEVTPERRAELAARGIMPKGGDVDEAPATAAVQSGGAASQSK